MLKVREKRTDGRIGPGRMAQAGGSLGDPRGRALSGDFFAGESPPKRLAPGQRTLFLRQLSQKTDNLRRRPVDHTPGEELRHVYTMQNCSSKHHSSQLPRQNFDTFTPRKIPTECVEGHRSS